MPGVSVITPWRPGCPHREAAWAWVRARYDNLGWQVIEGTCPDGEWRKAVAIVDGVRRADHDLLVIADADCWSDGTPAAAAVVAAGAGWAVPGCHVRRLTEPATTEVLAGLEPHTGLPLEERPYPGVLAGGIVVMPRSTWETAPMDSRFTGWGQDDEAWTYALTGTVGAPVLLSWHTWPLWHLWHPPQPRMSRAVGSQAGHALRRRYITARNSPARLRALIEEGRPECPLSTSPTSKPSSAAT